VSERGWGEEREGENKAHVKVNVIDVLFVTN
jgi:hypothetical protein